MRQLGPACAAALLLGTAVAHAEPPLLYFYPPSIRAASGAIIASPLARTQDQVTKDAPNLPGMAGIVVVLPWSLLCPTQEGCDFSIIRRTADYWHARGRRIVLGVATVGFPLPALGGHGVQTVTPDWVLRQSHTYSTRSRLAGAGNPDARADVAFPDYGDPRFVRLVDLLVAGLARFDGDPGIAQIRISTGLQSEDNPSPAGGRWLIDGYTDHDWIDYCRTISRVYQSQFHHTQLEFDLGVVALAWQRGDARTREDADALVTALIAQGTFLAFDGLSDRTLADIQNNVTATDWQGRIMHYLRQSIAAGHAVGLEAVSPLTAPTMQDVPGIARAVLTLPASRLVLFPFAAARLDQERHGGKPGDKAADAWIAAQPNGGSFSAHLHRLLGLLGLTTDHGTG